MSIISSRLFPANGLSKYKREKVDPIKDALTHWITRTIQNGGRSIRLAVSIGRGIIINEHASRCSFAFISSLGILHGRHMAVERKGIGRKEVFQHDRIMFQTAYWEEEEDGRWRGRCAHVKAGTRWGHVPYILEERERASFVEAPETGVNCQPLGRASPDIVVLQSLNSRTSRSVWSYANNRTTTIWMYPFVYSFANNQPRFRRKEKEILNYDEIIALWISRFRRKRISQIWNLGNYLENPNSHYLISILQHNFSKILSITLKLILIRYPRRERIFSQSTDGKNFLWR